MTRRDECERSRSDGSGHPTEHTLSGTPGPWLAHYTYDALGRLIRKQTPVRNASTGAQTGVRTERYYYDGARRIQEVVAAPIELIEPFTGGGGSGGDPLDGGTNIGDEMLAQGGEPTQPGGGGSPGGGSGTPIEIQDVWLDREYVYAPSNAGGYVDDFIAQIDRFNDVWFVLQDANFNVLGLTDSGGELVEQRTYDPYGELLTRESFTAHPGFKASHQGLFFDRLEPSPAVGGSVSMGAASQLEPNTFGVYQVRNRVLIPRYGRWAQKDPNASGMLHASLWHDGQSPSPDLAAGSLDAMLGDGANLFAFVGNSPFNATDPSGLFGFVSGLMSGLNLFDTMTGVLDQAKQGVQSGASIVDMMDAYQSALYDMIEWALDPNAAWDEYAYGYTGSPSSGTYEAEDSSTVFAAIGGKKGGGGSSGWNPKTWVGRKHGGKAHQDAMQKYAKR